MNTLIGLSVILTCIFHTRAEEYGNENKCRHTKDASKTLSLSVLSHRNETGKWSTTFTALHEGESGSIPTNITVDVTHGVTDCGGRTRIRITGYIAEDMAHLKLLTAKHHLGELLFDPKGGTNVAVVNNGRSVQKINLEVALESVVFTNRPLADDELFEVRLDKKNSKFVHSLGIGATTNSPREIGVFNHINHLPQPTWAMYHGHLYQNGSLSFKNYGRDLNLLVVGDRVGVLRSALGNIHFYVNGVDQGPAASNVPHPIYGVLELWHNAAMATIVN